VQVDLQAREICGHKPFGASRYGADRDPARLGATVYLAIEHEAAAVDGAMASGERTNVRMLQRALMVVHHGKYCAYYRVSTDKQGIDDRGILPNPNLRETKKRLFAIPGKVSALLVGCDRAAIEAKLHDKIAEALAELSSPGEYGRRRRRQRRLRRKRR
jgi:hypothetical protein